MAAALAPALVLCLYYFWIKRRVLVKAYFALAGAFIANAIILINSRGAVLASGLSLSLFMYHMYFSRFKRKHQRWSIIWLTVFGLAGLFYLMDTTFFARVETMEDTKVTVRHESGTTRVIFWESAWKMAKDHPLGAGYLGFDYYAPMYIPEDVDTGGYTRHRSVHSTWFEALTEIGYLGLLVLLLLVYSCYKAIRTCRKVLNEKNDVDNYYKILALEAAFFAYIIAMTFLNRLRAEVFYWLILYLVCAYNIYVLQPGSDPAHQQRRSPRRLFVPQRPRD